ncbi:MAG TPA: hypothetical protein VFR23_20670 [Jiangellaceae bacterium]|nr:hypothetical protein [Jiangellaceae bacterium]
MKRDIPGGDVLCCYPHTGINVQHSFMVSLMGVMNYDAANHTRLFTSDGPLMMRCGTSGLPDARNKAMRHFLDVATEEWLWFIDTDMGFTVDIVDRMVASAHPTERPVLGALCFGLRMTDPDGHGGYFTEPFPTIYGWTDEGDSVGNPYGFRGVRDYPMNTRVRVAGTGTGCLLIHRSAGEKVRAEYGDVWFDPVKYPDGRFVSEDLSFCYRLGQVGIPVHVDTAIQTTHAKTFWLSERDWIAHRAIQDALRAHTAGASAAPPANDETGMAV